LRQFGRAREGFELLAAKYKSKRKGEEELLLYEIKSLLSSLVEMFGQSFIILDAMDECDTFGEAGERRNLMELFDDLLGLQASAKIFFSSRPESDIKEYMKDWPTVHVTATLTKLDLNNYVNRTIDRKLRRKKNCDDILRNQLKELLKDRGQG
jgi:hypothetical protein